MTTLDVIEIDTVANVGDQARQYRLAPLPLNLREPQAIITPFSRMYTMASFAKNLPKTEPG